MKNQFLYAMAGVVQIVLSCEKLVETDLPRNQLTPQYVFEDSINANAAIAGIYVDMLQAFGPGFASGAVTIYTGLSADELYLTADNQNREFYAANIQPTNSTNQTLWNNAYKHIYATNACIEGVLSSPTLTKSQKDHFLGEILVIRSLLYFNLVNIYGAIPLVLSTDYEQNRLLPRTDTPEVYARVIEDLKMAKTNLSKIPPAENLRAGHYAASALLARAYLYTKDYKSALEEADYIIREGHYRIEPSLDDVFKVSSREIIWGFAPVYPGRETWEAYYFVPSSATAIPTYVITDRLYSSFDAADIRKENWIRVNINGGNEYPVPYKYKLNALQTSVQERYSVLRLAEIYLIRAEARAYLDDIPGAEEDINLLRQRADLLPAVADNRSEIIEAVMRERRCELMCEWGHRWFDLKRSGTAEEILTPLKPGWETSDALYPIPQTELNSNPNLTQNDGY